MPVFISEEDINTIGLSVDIIGQLVSVMRRVMSWKNPQVFADPQIEYTTRLLDEQAAILDGSDVDMARSTHRITHEGDYRIRWDGIDVQLVEVVENGNFALINVGKHDLAQDWFVSRWPDVDSRVSTARHDHFGQLSGAGKFSTFDPNHQSSVRGVDLAMSRTIV